MRRQQALRFSRSCRRTSFRKQRWALANMHNPEYQAPECAFSCLCALQDLWSDFETLDDAHKVMSLASVCMYVCTICMRPLNFTDICWPAGCKTQGFQQVRQHRRCTKLGNSPRRQQTQQRCPPETLTSSVPACLHSRMTLCQAICS